jgi:YD repeat-containing protein
MMISRRAGLTRVFLGGIASACFFPSRADAQENVTYMYDALGRVVGVHYGTGETLSYRYDAAGNRTEVTTAGFVSTIAIPASNAGINLRSLANAAGYTGAEAATITFEVNNAIVVNGTPGSPTGGHGIDTGTWPTGSYSIALSLIVKSGGIVRGGGGQGGAGGGGGGSPAGGPGGAGGDAIYCRLPITINFNAGSEIKGGGGGGGGAARGPNPSPPPLNVGGGGGGGGYPNGLGGTGAGVNQAQPGTTAGGGVGGGVVGGNIGATGGGPATNGGSVSGAGGVGGYCVRKNGHTVPVTNNGTTAGTIG